MLGRTNYSAKEKGNKWIIQALTNKAKKRDGKKDILKNTEFVQFGDQRFPIEDLNQTTPEPTPTPDPTPTPEPTPSWSFDNEPLSEALWGFDNFGQTINSSDYGTVGADTNIANVFDSLSSPESGIVDLYSSQNTVAVLDTGVYAEHEDLFENTFVELGYDYVYDSTNTYDAQGHGTHVAGTIAAASNSLGVIGSNPVANIIPIKVLGDDGIGSISSILNGVYHAINAGAKILNMSLGSYSYPSATEWNVYYDVYTNSDTLIVAAAGNDSSYTDGFYYNDPVLYDPYYDDYYWNDYAIDAYPSAYAFDNIISIGNSTNDDTLNWSTNFGPGVDLFAPGSSILSSGNLYSNHYQYLSGTSMAAPLVAGVASGFWARNPSLSAEDVKWYLMNSVDTDNSFPEFSLSDRLNVQKLYDWMGSSSTNTTHLTSIPNKATPLPSAKEIKSNNEISFKPPSFAVRLRNINQLSSNLLDEKFVGILRGNHQKRDKNIKKLSKLHSSNHFLSGANKLEFSDNSNLIGILDLKSDEGIDRRRILKFLLTKKFFKGFDVDRSYSSPKPYESLEETTTKIPKSYKIADFNSTFFVRELDNDVNGTKQANFIATGPGNDLIKAGAGDDLLIGDEGDDKIFGQAGDDDLRGGNGDDVFKGNKGVDIITTGRGKDKVHISQIDTVTDFDLDKDKIILDDYTLIAAKNIESSVELTFRSPQSNETSYLNLEGISKKDFMTAEPFI